MSLALNVPSKSSVVFELRYGEHTHTHSVDGYRRSPCPMCGGCTWHGNNTTDDEKATRQSICRGEQMIMLCFLPLFTLVSSGSISALTEADLGYCCSLFDVAGFLDFPYWFASIFNTYYFTTTSVRWKASDFIANMSCLAQLVALRSTPRMHVCTCFVSPRCRAWRAHRGRLNPNSRCVRYDVRGAAGNVQASV